MATVPPTITALPTPPDPNDRSTFNTRAYPWSVAQQTLAVEVNAVAANVYANAQEAKTQAEAATTNGAAQVALATAQAQTATTKAGEASTSAASAASSATAALASKNAAATSAADAEASRIAASKLNLGNKAAPPTVDNQGAALLAGATYYDTTLNKWRVWTGADWGDGISAMAGVTSVNGQTGDLTGFVTDTGVQTLANKTLTDPKITLGGTNGAAGQVPVSQGAGLPPAWGAVAGVGNDYQEFLSSGTWTKPSGATWVYVEAIGGGGGGRSGAFSGNNAQGGGGGEFTSRLMRASDVAATVTVTVGAGGAGGPIGGDNGSNGGNSAFGSHVTGRGGAGGRTGAANTSFTGLPGGPTGTTIENIGGAIYPQAGPGGAPNAKGVSTIYGGAGGGGCNGTNRNGGTSLYGGNGGDAVAVGAGQNGSQPGGGGGANSDPSTPAGSGAAGRVRVWAW